MEMYFISFLKNSSLFNVSIFIIIENLIIFLLAILLGEITIKLFHKRAISLSNKKVSGEEIFWGISSILLNSFVTFLGLLMWRAEIIKFTDKNILFSLLDTLLLLIIMDFAMYFLHRLAHNKYIFDRIHKLHHKYTDPTPITLFILSPSEAIGFGMLWLFVLCLHDWSWIGMFLYLTLNVAFGTIGHLGVEPFPKQWIKLPVLKYISTSTFHFQHHNHKDSNYGFYTTIWDKFFKTLESNYERDFVRNSSINNSSLNPSIDKSL